MATIPARLAQTAKTSANWNEARSRSLALYRDFYRSVSKPQHSLFSLGTILYLLSSLYLPSSFFLTFDLCIVRKGT